MEIKKELPKRKPLRLRDFDYSIPGAYFITICTHNKTAMLSHVVGAIHESPLRSRSVISKIVGYLKMNVSKEIHQQNEKCPVWQRGFHDHIIRDRRDYEEHVKYICENPAKRHFDPLYV